MSPPDARPHTHEGSPIRSPSGSNGRLSPSVLLALVLLMTFAAYAPTLRYDFVHDDRGQIVENPAVQSWKHFPRYFTHQVWEGYAPGVAGNYYRPVFLIWLRLNDMIFGHHAWGWHLTTILLHVLTTLLVYFLALRLLHESVAAGIAALLFGMHPVHIEAVAWISGLTEPLMAVFFILAFLCHLRGRETAEHRGRWRALALLSFVVAIFEKETAVVLPLLISAYEWIHADPDPGSRLNPNLARKAAAAVKPALPYFALIVPYLIARIIALGGFSHAMAPMPLSTVLLTTPFLLTFWIKHLVWPVGLSTFYDYPAVEHLSLENFGLPAVIVILVCLLGIVAARESRAVSFSLAWIVLPLLPILDIRVFEKNDFAHDRYLYLPSVGFAVLAALVLQRLPAIKSFRGIPVTQAALLFVLVPLMALGVGRESAYFANNWTFYGHCARTAPNNHLALTDFAAELGERGKYAEALQILNRVVREDPSFWYAVYNLGFTYYRLGQLSEAEEYFGRAIVLQPDVAKEHLYLGLVKLKTDRMDEAEISVRRAIQLDPQGYGHHFALGIILKQRGELTQAWQEMRTELMNHPENATARQQMAEIEARVRN